MLATQNDPSNFSDPNELLLHWRAERAFRVGRTFSYFGLVLALLCVVFDFMWSPLAVVIADLVLCVGCVLSLAFTVNTPTKTYFCWWPLYLGYWVSMWPSLWATGGINSPLVAIFLCLMFLFGVIVQVRIRPVFVAIFVMAHLPAFYLLTVFTGFSSEPLPPIALTGTMHALGTFALIVLIYTLMKTERQLSAEFSTRYQELNSTKEELRREEAANLAKTTFLANVSHELRTPLAAILGYTELLSKAESSQADKVVYTETIRRNGQQLSRLVDDLLDLSKVEAGTVEIESVPIKISELLTDIYSLSETNAKKKNLKLSFSFLNAIPETLSADPTRLRQILLNLVNNAIKFTERGEVSVKVSFLPEGVLTFAVKDTGRGILYHEQDRLFKPFSQGDPSLARRYGGTGLGLSLSRKLAQMMGGHLILKESLAGAGSTFEFQLPFVPPEPDSPVIWLNEFKPSRAPAPKLNSFSIDRLKGKKFLFVDDTIDNQQLIRVYLGSVGAEVVTASNGYEGVDRALNDDFDLVLMDVQMPLMDGYEAVSTLRSKNYKKPILALTAHAMKEDWDRCIAVGCNGHLSKPISSQELIFAIEATLNAHTQLEKLSMQETSRVATYY